MLDFREFVDEEKRQVPYANGMEETVCYICWMDMFLEAYRSDDDEKHIRQQLREGEQILSNRTMLSQGEELPLEYGISITNIAWEYGLRGFGFFCLLLAIAPEMDNKYLKIFDELADDERLAGPTFDLAESLYSQIAAEEELFDMRRQLNNLSNCGLFNIEPPRHYTSRIGASFTASSQLLSVIKGDYVLPKSLENICEQHEGRGEDDVFVYKKELIGLKNYLYAKDAEKELIQIKEKEGGMAQDFTLNAFRKGFPVLFLSLRSLMASGKENAFSLLNEALIRCRLLGMGFVLKDTRDLEVAALESAINICFSEADRMYIITGEDISLKEERLSCDIFKVSLGIPEISERLILWEKAFEKCDISGDISPAELASKYRLTPGEIRLCVNEALSLAASERRTAITAEDITLAVLSHTTGELDELCERIPLKFTRDDLVVDDKQRKIMDTLVSRIKNRSIVDSEWGFEEKIPYGRGVSMLLYGPPGTGKTMAAQVMAREIGMALYRVDLSRLVDKYIGETEKNIGRIFDAASGGNVILFFDEADALFAKRTEVSSSNDKHANTEVAFLLQRIEQFDGVTFLATNRYNNFDDAFIRRINYAVYLERPDAKRRLELYENILPDKMPKESDLDLKFFAEKFDFSGSDIKEILYSAAFIAAKENSPLSNAHLVQAVKYHQEKSGKLVSAAEFGEYSYLVL